jgi:hypothetical protein
MKRLNLLAASTALLTWSLAAQAAPRSTPPYSSAQAEATLGQIDEWSANIADTAFHLSDMAQHQLDPQSHLEGLDNLKHDINWIGVDVSVLEAERNSLAAWEVQALDQIVPLMHDAAANAEKAIQTFNSDRRRLWATSYVEDTAKIAEDTNKVAALIHNYLKLEKTQEREQRIERDLGSAGQF